MRLALQKKHDERNEDLVPISDTEVVLDGTGYRGTMKVVNYGGNPKAAYVVHGLRRCRLPDCTIDVVFLETIRPLAADDELLAHYGWYMSERNKQVICE